jgi:hypothetical protein
MGTLTNDELDAKIEEIETALEATNTAYLAALTGDYKSYKVDSPGGSQQVNRRKLSEYRDEMRALESQLEYYKRRRSGRGNPGLNLRRRW